MVQNKFKESIIFARELSGKYSNSIQAQENPKLFAHINIYFQPLPWFIFEGPGFYSEQSYEYDPWAPYRQSVYKLLVSDHTLILENYKFNSRERVAGAGFRPELINDLDWNSLEVRYGCSMHFKKINSAHYIGKIEDGFKCKILRNCQMTYLASQAELCNQTLKTLDQGYDIQSNKLIWGSEHGPFYFQKLEERDTLIGEDWLRR